MSSSAAEADTQQPSRWWLRGIALVWLGLFCWWFHSFELPRRQVWPGLTDILLENVYPTPTPDAPPSGWSYLPQRFGILSLSGFLLAGAWGLGNLALRGLRLQQAFDVPSRLVFAFGLGLSGLSLLTLGLGLAGRLHRGLFIAAVVISLAGELVCRLRSYRPVAETPQIRWWQRRWSGLPIVCLAAVAPFLLAMLLGAMLPSTDFDVKAYHLEGPKEYFLQGQVTFLPHNVYTSFPFLTEMLSLLGMVLKDDWYMGALVGKSVLMSFAPLTAIGLFAAARRCFNASAGWLCVLLYLSTPWVYRISIIAYAEGGLTFYLFATVLSVIWTLTPDETSVPIRRSMVLLCGLLAGSAVACKYPGVLSVAIPLGGFLLLAAWRTQTATQEATSANDTTQALSAPVRLRGVAVTAGLFTLGTLITFGPWMAKNIAETGNPVYPLLYNVFGGTDWDPASHRKWQQGHPPTIVLLGDQARDLVSNLGTRIVDVVARSDWQNPLLFGAAPLALLWWGRRKFVAAVWSYIGWLFLSWWALTHQIDRFWVPMLPVGALLAGAGLAALLRGHSDVLSDGEPPRRRWFSWLVATGASFVVGLCVLFNLAYITTYLCGYNAYLIDLETARRNVMHPGIALLHERLPPDANVLFVGEAQVFDAEFDYVYNTVFDECLFERWTSAAIPGLSPAAQPLRSAGQIRETLAEHGITHVFVNWSEILRYRTTYGYTEYVSPQRFRDLEQAGVLEPVPLDPYRGLRLWESVDPQAREIVAAWGATLHLQVGGSEALQQYELFEVR
jgi:hypothetical protein